MRYDHVAIPDDDIPQTADPAYRHVVETYASETNKTASMWRAIPDDRLDVKPDQKVNSIRTILVHKLLSERRFFGQFLSTDEPPADQLLPSGERRPAEANIDKYLWLAKRGLPQFAGATSEWWLEETRFFGGLKRQRIWTFWRRVPHTCHPRAQVQTWLRLPGVQPAPPIYGPSGDVTWDEADPTDSVEAVER